MKTVKNIYIKSLLLMLVVILGGTNLQAQEKAAAKLKLSYAKHMDGTYEIKAHAFVKKGKEIEHCTGINIGLYTDADYEKQVSKEPTDEMGMTTLKLTTAEAAKFKDSTGHYHFYCRIEKNEKYKSQEADVSAMDAVITANFKQQSDTERIVEASLSIYDEKTGKLVPGAKMPLKCFVKRSLCSLPVGEDLHYTDSTGHVAINFPNDIPGDAKGTLTVIVKLDEDDNYGSVIFEKEVTWGKHLEASENPIGHRSLIGARNNAPWFMVIAINAMLLTIWGYLFFVVYELYRIKKLSDLAK